MKIGVTVGGSDRWSSEVVNAERSDPSYLTTEVLRVIFTCFLNDSGLNGKGSVD